MSVLIGADNDCWYVKTEDHISVAIPSPVFTELLKTSPVVQGAVDRFLISGDCLTLPVNSKPLLSLIAMMMNFKTANLPKSVVLENLQALHSLRSTLLVKRLYQPYVYLHFKDTVLSLTQTLIPKTHWQKWSPCFEKNIIDQSTDDPIDRILLNITQKEFINTIKREQANPSASIKNWWFSIISSRSLFENFMGTINEEFEDQDVHFTIRDDNLRLFLTRNQKVREYCLSLDDSSYICTSRFNLNKIRIFGETILGVVDNTLYDIVPDFSAKKELVRVMENTRFAANKSLVLCCVMNGFYLFDIKNPSRKVIHFLQGSLKNVIPFLQGFLLQFWNGQFFYCTEKNRRDSFCMTLSQHETIQGSMFDGQILVTSQDTEPSTLSLIPFINMTATPEVKIELILPTRHYCIQNEAIVYYDQKGISHIVPDENFVAAVTAIIANPGSLSSLYDAVTMK